MIKKIVWQWEILDEATSRAKVIGGWLVRYGNIVISGKNSHYSESMVFLPDHNHEWVILPPYVENPAQVKKDIAKDFAPPPKEFPV